MIVYVYLKSFGNITKKIKKEKLYLENKPDTLREFISQAVISCVKAYREKNEENNLPCPISEEEYKEMREIGKFAFGIHYNQNDVNEDASIKIAIDAFNDGLVRIFKDNTELVDLDGKTDISEGDEFTFIKLTMLSGRMW